MRRLSILFLLAASLLAATGCPQEDEGLPPDITLEGGNIYAIELGESLTLSPGFVNLTPDAVIRWLCNGNVVCTGPSFTFTPEENGVFYFTVEVTTLFGRAFKEIRINVQLPEPPTPPTPPEPPAPADTLSYTFDQTEFHVAQGRAIRLVPFDLDTNKSLTFTWLVDGVVRQQGADPLFRFEATSRGRFTATIRIE